MEQYKLLAVDMDGTLLNSEKCISAANREALLEASRRGITVVLSTGRTLCQLTEHLDQLPEIRYAILASGAAVYDRFSGVTVIRSIPVRTAEDILDLTDGTDRMVQLLYPYSGIIEQTAMDRLEHYHMGSRRKDYPRQMTIVGAIRSAIQSACEPLLKMNLYFSSTADRAEAIAKLRGTDAETVFSEISSIECSPSGISKGAALLSLCGDLGITPQQVMAVGDADNDLPMLKAADWPVAMGNADRHVKEFCRTVVKDCDHDGCAEAIRLLWS